MTITHDFRAIELLDLDPIKVKLMHKESGEGWSESRTNAVEREYRRFLILMKKYPNEPTSPTVDVDTFWHYHILDTAKYADDCEQVFGYFLHHFPYVGMRGKEDEEALQRMGERMRAAYEETFGDDYYAAARACAETVDRAGHGEQGAAATPRTRLSASKPACHSRGSVLAAGRNDVARGTTSAKPRRLRSITAKLAKSGGATAAAPAYCGVATKPAYCGVATKAAYCGVATKPAYCGVATKPAYCGVSTKPAYCGVATKPAYCGVSTKPAYCGVSTKPAYCGVATKPAYCGVTATEPAYCGVATVSLDASPSLPREQHPGFYLDRPALAKA